MEIPWVDNITKEYHFIHLIGKGTFGSVYEVEKNGVSYALKMMSTRKLGDKARNILLREVTILRMLNHPSIIKCHDFFNCHFIDTNETFYCLLLDLARGFSLDNYVKTFQLRKDEVEYITLNLIEILNYISNKGVIHRDIKSSNVIYDPFTKIVMLIDFGFAAVYNNDKIWKIDNLLKIYGTALYMAPELIFSAFSIENLPKTDVWSLGILVYYMFFRRVPFDAKDYTSFKKIMMQVPKLNFDNSDLPYKVRIVLEKTLVQDVEERSSTQDLLKLW